MAGEDCNPVRNRRSGTSSSAYGASEKDEMQRRTEGERSSQTSSNGRVDVDHVITRKMQLIAEAEQLKPAFMKEVDSHFTEFVDSLIEKSVILESSTPASTFSTASSEKDVHKNRGLRAPPEHGKIFTARRSLLDELFELSHIRTIYHMFIALLIIFILSTVVVDFIDEGRLVLDFDLLVFAFGKSTVVACTWPCMFLGTFIIPYGLFHQWAQGYSSSSHQTIRSFFYGMLFVLFQVIGLGIGPVYVAVAYALPPASGFIVMLEQVRLIMKGHSFIRENVPRVLSSAKEKSSTVPVPRITQYLYFLFAPTLIYRDSYPRTPRIRWSYVATKFAQVLGSLFYSYYIFVRLCIPQFRNISQEPFNLRALVLCIFNSILPGILIYFLIFFAFLHCWLNAFAEMLRFADRMFYQDWWNSTSYANYYRTWNVVVHDWLYYYAYRDILWLFGKKFKAAAMLSVFAISAAVHEYVLAVCFGYFYPVLFCLFMCFGMVFNFVLNDRRKGPFWNVIMWTSLFLGQGVIICLYSQEWYAHQYCPIKNPTFLDYMKPRSWTCRHVQI
ncbi:PREDICTED: sterol O-acyltransferase 1 isoform X1 [Gavialis gangeticus]|uniref:sterol O-acyltransferase 1 isoform X1 n=1 Tax=Gavialis gangeticus TaxID=94835 RepID=UPI00092F352F|nr:PREDICTED: sterol O-acyltransferase 1 isoform X1 [Gavialis gangeticus]XP_019357354.1 PREDICTED: sterol O-acyltransferase 1 isoform X1 [Gavialis gangeticus]